MTNGLELKNTDATVTETEEDQKRRKEALMIWEEMQRKHGDKLPYVFMGILSKAMQDNWMLQHIEDIVEHVSEKGGAMKALREILTLLKTRQKK